MAKIASTASGSKAMALSLHIGLNEVDPGHYEGWRGELTACEFDAKDMAALAASRGIKASVLLTRKATRAAALKGIRQAAKALKAGDLFLLTYSGHGGQVPDVNGDEPDKKDETWCLFDGELIDDEIYFDLSKFKAGVRVLILSDSCHSGTVARARVPEMPSHGRSKMMPPPVASRTYAAHKAYYDALQAGVSKAAGGKGVAEPDEVLARIHATASGRLTGIAGRTKASVILISGCQDNQTSMDGDHNGAFTEQLLRVWDDGRFSQAGTYATFHAAIKAGLPSTQSPNLFTLGPVAGFIAQRPFTV